MKTYPDFIQSFIARFRNDVYLESIQDGTVASDKFLGLDSNNKIVKEAIPAGLSITNATDNRVVTSTGGTGLNAESTLTYVSETLTISSTSSSRPTVSLLNTNADENAPTFNFMKVGASAADNDTLGTILYTSTNYAGEGLSYADFVTTIADASDGDESGKVAIRVLADGNLRNFIDGTGTLDDIVDVSLAYGTTSTVTVAGNLSLGSTDGTSHEISLRPHDNGVGGNLAIKAGSVQGSAGNSNLSGGNLELYAGSATGAATGGNVEFYSTTRGSGGDDVNTAKKFASIEPGTNLSNFFLFEAAGATTDDYFQISCTTHGATIISTKDNSATAAHLEVNVDGDITFIPATGVVRAGWHGSTTRIKILPRDFVANDVGRPLMIEDDNVGSNALFLHSFSTSDAFAYVPIPSGYKATHVKINGSDTSQNFYVYKGVIDDKLIVDVATGTTAIGTEKALGTQVTSDLTNYLIIRVTSDGSTDEIYGGYVTIATV